MWYGETTDEIYRKFVTSGLCSEHLKKSAKDSRVAAESQKLKTFVFQRLRLLIMDHLLFEERHPEDFAMKWDDEEQIEEPSFLKDGFLRDDMRDHVVFLDSVTLYVMCTYILTTSCCPAGYCYDLKHSKKYGNDESGKVELKGIKQVTSLTKKRFLKYSSIKMPEDIKSTFEDYVMNVLCKTCYLVNKGLKAFFNKDLIPEIQDNDAEAENLKQLGNKEYKQGNYEKAFHAYNSALGICPQNYILLSNRAQACMKMRKYQQAEMDYRWSLSINPAWIKAYYGLVTALMNQGFFHAAHTVADYGIQDCKDGPPEVLQKLHSLKMELKERCIKRKTCIAPKPSDKKHEITIMKLLDSLNDDVPDLIDDESSSSNECEAEENKEIKQEDGNKSDKSVHECDSKKQACSKTESGKAKDGVTAKAAKGEQHNDTSGTSKRKNSNKGNKIQNQDIVMETKKELIKAKREQIIPLLKEGHNALSENCGYAAVSKYEQVLNDYKANPELHEWKNPEIVCLKYALGCAYYKSATIEDLQKSITIHKEIIEDHKDIVFPAAFHGLGLAYLKLNRFKDALHYLNEARAIIDRGINFTAHIYPGTTTVIEETKSEALKASLEDLVTTCENPPPHDALCRYESCASRPHIYYSDPDFKGFYTICCSDLCTLQYHPQCWRAMKSITLLSDKEYLEKKCLTPDCGGIIIKVQCVVKDGSVDKTFTCEGKKKTQKQKKQKCEKKKAEPKEVKRRRRQDSNTSSEAKSEAMECLLVDDVPAPPALPELVHNSEIISEKECAQSQDKSESSTSTDVTEIPEPSYVLKKTSLKEEETLKPATKQKERKKLKKSVLSIEEFHSTEFGDSQLPANQDESMLLVGNYPSYAGCHRQNAYGSGDSVHYNSDEKTLFEAKDCQTWQYLDDDKSDNMHLTQDGKLFSFVDYYPWQNTYETLRNDLDPSNSCEMGDILGKDAYSLDSILKPADDNSVIATEIIKDRVYQYMEDILSYKGPLHIKDSELLEEYEDFPADAKVLITESGGLKQFLSKSSRFASVRGYICASSDISRAYELASSDTTHQGADESESVEHLEFNSYNSSVQSSIASRLNPEAVEYKPPEKSFENGPCEDESAKDNCKSGSESGDLNSVDFDIPEECVKPKKNFLDYLKMCVSRKIPLEQLKFLLPYIELFKTIMAPLRKDEEIQTLEVESGSRGAEELEDKLSRLIEEKNELLSIVSNLESEKQYLQDSSSKFRKKLELEMDNIQKKLEDTMAELQARKNELNDSKRNWELKFKQMMLSVAKADELAQELGRSKSYIKKLEEDLGMVKSENASLKISFRGIEDDCKMASTWKEQLQSSVTRAVAAEVDILNLQKDYFVKSIDAKILEGNNRLKELETGATAFGQYPSVTSAISMLLPDFYEYLSKLSVKRIQVMKDIDAHIRKITEGTPLKQLSRIKVGDLPEMPTLQKKLQQGPQVPNSSSLYGMNEVLSTLQAVNGMSKPSPTVPMGNAPQRPSGLQNSMHPPASNVTLSRPPHTPTPPPEDFVPSHNRFERFSRAPGTAVFKTISVNDSRLSVDSSQATSKPKVDGRDKVESASSSLLSSASTSSESLSSNKSSRNDVPKHILAGASSSTSQSSLVPEKQPEDNAVSTNVPITQSRMEIRKRYEKLINLLRAKYPHCSHMTLMEYIKDYRTAHHKKFQALQVENVAMEIIQTVESRNNSQLKPSTRQLEENVIPRFRPQAVNNQGRAHQVTLVNKPLTTPKLTKPGKPLEKLAAAECPWASLPSNELQAWSGSAEDTSCTICMEDMSPRTSYKVDCGHKFHAHCIKAWLNKTSTCPICRLHLLLPEDYPSLR